MATIGPLSSLVQFLGTWAAWPFYAALMFVLLGSGAAIWVPVLRGLAEERRLKRKSSIALIADAHALIASLEARGLNAADLQLTKDHVFRNAGLTPGPAKLAADAQREAGQALDRAVASADLNLRLAGLSVAAAAFVAAVLIPLRRLMGWQLTFFNDGYNVRRSLSGGAEVAFVAYGSAVLAAVLAFVVLRLFVPHRSRLVRWSVGVVVAAAILAPL